MPIILRGFVLVHIKSVITLSRKSKKLHLR